MLSSIIQSEITLPVFFICTVASLILGIGTSLVSMYKSRHTQSLAITLAILPAVVQIVVMLVNGSIGAGVAVAGAFSLVRFRSVPGNAKEISTIFLSMAIGLATGMGYIVLAVLFFAMAAAVVLLLTAANFGHRDSLERNLKITIPENLDYDNLFDDLFDAYTSKYTLESVKTSNMGTLYELHYLITLKSAGIPKPLLDEIRCRNGNLNIVCSKVSADEIHDL